MSNFKALSLATFFLAGCAGQDLIQSIDWERLIRKSTENVNVNLDGNMLSMAQKFLSNTDPDEAKAKKLIGNVKGIYVRSLKFKQAGDYNMADVEKLRNNFSGPAWSKVVEAKNTDGKSENVGIYMKNNGSKIEGIVILATEPKGLTVVQVVGSIDPDQLKALGDAGLIPQVGGMNSKKSGAKQKDDE